MEDYKKFLVEGRENCGVNGEKYEDYVRNNYNKYPPLYLELKVNEKGQYYVYYPSMPLFKFQGFKLNGEIFPNESFKLIESFPGTGSSLQIYNKL